MAGHNIKRVILTHEAGRDGFWLARFLVRRGVEVHVMQPSSLVFGQMTVDQNREISALLIDVKTKVAA